MAIHLTEAQENVIRERIRAAGTGRGWAEAHGFSSPFVSDLLNGKRGTSDRVLAAVGMRVELVEASAKVER